MILLKQLELQVTILYTNNLFLYIFLININKFQWPSKLWPLNTPTASLHKGKTPLTSVLDIT